MRISVCMIVRNEEKLLGQAYASTAGLADEVVIVDTGSTDRTAMLARELGALVFTGADRMHKAQARNRAQDEASGDWVVVLDADECIADPVGLRAFLEETDAKAVYIRQTYLDAQDQPTLFNHQMRCWRRGSYCYKYRAHELPVPVEDSGKTAYTDFVWEHRQTQTQAWKTQYTLDRLLLDVEENPGTGRPVYYLGRQYMYMQEWALALETLEQYLDSPGFDAADAWCDVAKCKGSLGDKQGQIDALHRACAIMPGRREWWGELATIYHGRGKYQLAVGLLKCALEIPMSTRSYVRHYWFGSAIHDLLARCLWKLERYDEGHEHAQQAVELEPDNQRLRTNLGWFEGKLDRHDPALEAARMDAFYRRNGPSVHEKMGRHREIADLVHGERVLDIGCGTGDLLQLLQRNGYERLAGTDISGVALEMARERGITAELLHTDKVPEGPFSTVIMSQVLEHVPEDQELVKAAAEQLEDGGLLIVSVPKEDCIPAASHKREYDELALAQLLEPVGEVGLHDWSDSYRLLMTVWKRQGCPQI